MKEREIIFSIGTATKEAVFSHLLKCSVGFVNELAKRTDIEEYADKIVAKAKTFEAWENKILVGLVAAYVNDPERKSSFITNVSVVEDLIGKGIAPELLERFINYARQNQFKEISLEVNKENHRAIKFYKKSGFLESGTEGEVIFLKRKLATNKH